MYHSSPHSGGYLNPRRRLHAGFPDITKIRMGGGFFDFGQNMFIFFAPI
jgi:hypothetical protein